MTDTIESLQAERTMLFGEIASLGRRLDALQGSRLDPQCPACGTGLGITTSSMLGSEALEDGLVRSVVSTEFRVPMSAGGRTCGHCEARLSAEPCSIESRVVPSPDGQLWVASMVRYGILQVVTAYEQMLEQRGMFPKRTRRGR